MLERHLKSERGLIQRVIERESARAESQCRIEREHRTHRERERERTSIGEIESVRV